jgi:hypothetical protein
MRVKYWLETGQSMPVRTAAAAKPKAAAKAPATAKKVKVRAAKSIDARGG